MPVEYKQVMTLSVAAMQWSLPLRVFVPLRQIQIMYAVVLIIGTVQNLKKRVKTLI